MDYYSLQNGSDVRGIALEGIEGQHINLTKQAVSDIAAAFGIWLMAKYKKSPQSIKVGIGRDSRLTGEAFASCAADSLREIGINVYDCSMASTPAMFMATIATGYEYDGTIMLTASHLPYNRNGMKFFTRDGGLDKGDIKAILEIASKGGFEPAKSWGEFHTVDFMETYAQILANKIRDGVKAENYDQPLLGYKIVVDAGNGAGGFYVDKVLKPLGADTTGSQFLEPDGNFPNHMPNPEDKEAMEAIINAVKLSRADMGIIFDTDVDRAGAVDEAGKEINRNRLIAMISAIMLEDHPGTTIVTDSITSSGLKSFIEKKGGVHLRFKRGYKNVINESIRLNNEGIDSQCAIETSGHGALKENYFLDDGAYVVTKLIIKLAKLKKEGKGLGSLISDLAEPKDATEIRMNIAAEDFKAYGNEIIEKLRAHAQAEGWQIAPDNHEGIRISFSKGEGEGWFLMRLSLHDPLIPLNIESDAQGGCVLIASKLLSFLKQFEKLDICRLEGYVG